MAGECTLHCLELDAVRKLRGKKGECCCCCWEICQRGSDGRRDVRYIAWNVTRSGNLGERRASAAAAAGKSVNEVQMAGVMCYTCVVPWKVSVPVTMAMILRVKTHLDVACTLGP
jgi:hypothetical protein